MRHLKAGKKLNRDTKHRQALYRQLMIDLVLHEKLQTTEAKAKAVKPNFEKLITVAKQGTLAARRQVHKTLPKSRLVNKLVDDIAPRYQNRSGGYTQIIKAAYRRGDNSRLVTWQLVKTNLKNTAPSRQKSVPAKLTASKKTKSVLTKPLAGQTTKSKKKAK